MRESGSVRSLAAEVLRYVMANPEAKDTVEGIHRWWLRQPEQWSGMEVHAVLEMLVERKCLSASTAASGALIFGASAELRDNSALCLEFLKGGTF